jgi:NDP-sugar pyrophosphorylase family protein
MYERIKRLWLNDAITKEGLLAAVHKKPKPWITMEQYEELVALKEEMKRKEEEEQEPETPKDDENPAEAD